MSKVILTIAVVVAMASSANSAKDGGTVSPFSFGAGARELSLGGADLAGCGFETAPFWNPSRLASAQRYQISGFHSKLFDSDVAYQYLGLIAPTLDFGTFGIGIFRLGVSGIEVRDINNALLGETDDDRLALYISYGRSLSNFDFGASITFEHHSLADYSATSSPGLNLSASKNLELNSNVFKRLTLSGNLVNVLRPSLELDAEGVKYPISAELSATLGITPLKDTVHGISLAVSLNKTDRVNPDAVVGIEYSFRDLLYLRSGINDSKLAAGIGIKYAAVSFDYAVIDRDLDLLHTFTLTTSFGKPVSQRVEEKLAKREAEFNRLMGERLTERNRGLVNSMMNEARRFFEEGRLPDAVSTFERALFMSKANGFDTTEVSGLLAETQTKLNEIFLLKQYRGNLDSANFAMANNDFISAKYFATTASDIQPNANEPKEIIESANKAINQNTARAELLQSRLFKADSLLSSGKITDAMNLLNGLKQTYSGDTRVEQLLRKANFERLRETATNNYTQRKYADALSALDSALALFPKHEWCLALKSSIISTQSATSLKQTASVTEPATKPSEQMLKEAEQEYQTAQSLFTSGKLTEAISHWENVERLAPDYQSVRKYLFKAYKFLGVEFYSKGQLREAIKVWELALKIAPGNEEISNYIQRTDTELKKLEKLSYESE